MNIKMYCSVCGGKASVMIVRESNILCLDCMAKEYPGQLARLVYYLTTTKRVGADDSPATGGLPSSYKFHDKIEPRTLVTSMSYQN